MLDTGVDHLKNISVMYVEDDQELAEAVEFTLNRHVKKLNIMRTAEDAILAYEKEHHDIVITDIALPFMDGVNLALRLKDINPDVIVMVVSGHKDEKYLLGSIEARVDCYITKPVDMRILRDHLYSAAERIYNRKQLENSRNFIKKIMESSREMYLVGNSGKISYVNSTLLEHFGYADVESLTKAIADEEQLTVVEKSGSGRVLSFKYWLTTVSKIDGYDGLVSILRAGVLKSDAKSWMVRVSRIVDDDMFVITFVDVTVMEKQKEILHNMAMKDPLTDIYNRYKFFNELSKETERSRRYGKSFSVIMFDIDRFKLINDGYGHQIGDSVLKELGALVNANLRITDIFARYGGEEFIIITPEVNRDGALLLAGKIKSIIAEHVFDHIEHITCSFGVAEYENGISEEEIVRLADEALYKAKSNGRNRVEII